MSESYGHEYPPGEWTVDRIAAAVDAADESFPIPTYEDEDVWSAIRSDGATGPLAESVIDRAAEECDRPIPALPASLYLDYDRTGNRRRYESQNARRVRRLGYFSMAECFEREGEYLDDVLDEAWAICEQSAWVLPAHLQSPENNEGLPGVVPDGDRTVALRTTMTAKYLAEVDYLLGDRLHPALRERIRNEVDRRVLTPYLARDDHHWMMPPTANWNAVCNASVSIAALYLCDDPERRARILHRTAMTLRHYIDSFDGSGCTVEGISYWNYGFGHYVQVSEHLHARTDGELSLLSPPILREIARFPQRIQLSFGRFVPFSDAIETDQPRPYLACRLGERLDEPGLVALGRRTLVTNPDHEDLSEMLRTLAWCHGLPDVSVPTPEREEFFGGCDWWFARANPDDPESVVVAAKGGHNGEAHNHNDCGSFVYHVGGESLLTDLGTHAYDADYFSDRRYEYLATRSLGHSVPYVNGYEQVAGETHAARIVNRVLDGSRTTFAVELADCYPDQAGLKSLERHFSLNTDDGTLEIDDRVRFVPDASEHVYESVLVSYHPITATDGELVVNGDRGTVRVSPSPVDDVRIERLNDAIDKSAPLDADSDFRDVWRAFVAGPEERELSVRTMIAPDLD